MDADLIKKALEVVREDCERMNKEREISDRVYRLNKMTSLDKILLEKYTNADLLSTATLTHILAEDIIRNCKSFDIETTRERALVIADNNADVSAAVEIRLQKVHQL